MGKSLIIKKHWISELREAKPINEENILLGQMALPCLFRSAEGINTDDVESKLPTKG
jgi:hypothetical protein